MGLSEDSNDIIQAVYKIEDKTVDIAAREFAKSIVRVKDATRWIQLNRFSKLTEEDKSKEQWKVWWKMLKTKKGTTFKRQKKLVWILKLLNNELPTADTLLVRRPDLCKEHLNCVWCGMEKHILTCKINLERPKLEATMRENITSILGQTKLNTRERKQILAAFDIALQDNDIADLFRMGILPASIYRTLKQRLKPTVFVDVTAKLIKAIFKNWHKHVW